MNRPEKSWFLTKAEALAVAKEASNYTAKRINGVWFYGVVVDYRARH